MTPPCNDNHNDQVLESEKKKRVGGNMGSF